MIRVDKKIRAVSFLDIRKDVFCHNNRPKNRKDTIVNRSVLMVAAEANSVRILVEVQLAPQKNIAVINKMLCLIM